MGELARLAKARQELEDLYLGVPDESVNLTFEDLAKLKNQLGVEESKKPNIMEPTLEIVLKDGLSPGKSPSLDFNRGLHAVRPHHQRQVEVDRMHVSRNHQHHVEDDRMHIYPKTITATTMQKRGGCTHLVAITTMMETQEGTSTSEMIIYMDMSVAYDDVSDVSMVARSGYHDAGRRRRRGIPHSNICTICCTYIHIFRHRCLVCGRVYFRHCVTVGMGEMIEGRKCVECLGRRFSQRYIHRAGAVGCCTRYPRLVKQQELEWAEKGPRGSRPRGYGRSIVRPRSRSPAPSTMSSARTNGGSATPMTSRSKSPVTPRTPMHDVHDSSASSFVASLQSSHFTPAHHHNSFLAKPTKEDTASTSSLQFVLHKIQVQDLEPCML